MVIISKGFKYYPFFSNNFHTKLVNYLHLYQDADKFNLKLLIRISINENENFQITLTL